MRYTKFGDVPLNLKIPGFNAHDGYYKPFQRSAVYLHSISFFILKNDEDFSSSFLFVILVEYFASSRAMDLQLRHLDT